MASQRKPPRWERRRPGTSHQPRPPGRACWLRLGCTGLTNDEFAARYPRVYHLAETGSWPSIERHGLLSVSAILDLVGIDGDERERLITSRRTEARVLT